MIESQYKQVALRVIYFLAIYVSVSCILVSEAASFRRHNSATYDEPYYFVNSVRVFKHGDFAELTKGGVAPLPLLLNFSVSAAVYADIAASRVAEQTAPCDDAISLARLTATWLVGVPLAITVVVWTHRRTGSPIAAWVAGLLLVFSPTVVAHTSLATTDACFSLFYLLALAMIGWFADRPCMTRALAAGLVVGLAIASKYSGVILIGISFLCCVFCELVNNRTYSLGRRIGHVIWWHPIRHIVLLATALLSCWAVTGFDLASPLFNKPAAETGPGQGLRRIFGSGPIADRLIDYLATHQQPSVVTSFLKQLRAVQYGGKVMINGKVYDNGHPLFYLYGFMWKSTPVELLLAVVAVATGGYHIYRSCLGRRKANPYEIALIVGAIVLFVASSRSPKQLGLRYILPLYPILFISAVSSCAAIRPHRPTIRLLLALALVIWQSVTLYLVWPYPLSYFNSLAGGSSHGVDRLGESDSDWGQGLIALREYLHLQGAEAAIVFTFVSASPDGAYGVRTLPHIRYETPPCRYIAISASAITWGKFSSGPLMNFDVLPPSCVVGHTYLIFETSDSAVWQTYLRVVDTSSKQP